MADVLLSDYLAYVLSQISRAREMADRYSKQIALEYANDEVLRHFSVPRFKLSRMDLTMPVLVSGVRVSSLLRFHMDRTDFGRLVLGKLDEILALVRTVKPGGRSRPGAAIEGIEPLVDAFHQELAALADLSRPEGLISGHWSAIVTKALAVHGIPGELTRLKPVAEIVARALLELTEGVKATFSVPRAKIEALLVNPETQVVKEGSSDTSVFTIKAELVEEGVLVKRVKDERTGAESTVVEFE